MLCVGEGTSKHRFRSHIYALAIQFEQLIEGLFQKRKEKRMEPGLVWKHPQLAERFLGHQAVMGQPSP